MSICRFCIECHEPLFFVQTDIVQEFSVAIAVDDERTVDFDIRHLTVQQ